MKLLYLRYELRYASRNNFTGVRLYPKNMRSAFLREEPALALAAAAKKLRQMNLGFKILDAYRPFLVTEKF